MNLLTNLFFRNELKFSFSSRRAKKGKKKNPQPPNQKNLYHSMTWPMTHMCHVRSCVKNCSVSEGNNKPGGVCFRCQCVSAGEHPVAIMVQVLTSCILSLNWAACQLFFFVNSQSFGRKSNKLLFSNGLIYLFSVPLKYTLTHCKDPGLSSP